jgi:hypothetical protein
MKHPLVDRDAAALCARPDGWLAPKDITDLFDGFQLPPAGTISQDLARLRENSLARTRRAKPGWALTPEGHATVAKLMGELDPAELAATPGAQLGNALHTLIMISFLVQHPSARRASFGVGLGAASPVK